MKKHVARFVLPATIALGAVGVQAAAGDPLPHQTDPDRHPVHGGQRDGHHRAHRQPQLVERCGKQVVTDNRPSAGGIVACSLVAEAAPDGHTLLVTGSNFAGSAALYSKLPFDAVKDFSGITQFASTPLVLVVVAEPRCEIGQGADRARAREAGAAQLRLDRLGSGPHYGAELFKLVAGIKAVHVPYRGSPGIAHRSHGRPRAVHPLAGPRGLAARQERQGAGAGRDDQLSRAGAAGRADDRGSGAAEVRVPGVVRHAGALAARRVQIVNCARRRSAPSSTGRGEGAHRRARAPSPSRARPRRSTSWSTRKSRRAARCGRPRG